MRNLANIIDFLVTMSTILAIVFTYNEIENLTVKAFKMMRLFRPLRIISKIEGLRKSF